VLQCVAVCFSVMKCDAVHRSVLQCNAACCSVLQYVAVCCSVLQCIAACYSVLQCGAVYCSVLQCVAVCCTSLPASKPSTWNEYTGWRSLIGCLQLQVILHKRATNYRALLHKMTYEDKASYDSTPLCRVLHF